LSKRGDKREKKGAKGKKVEEESTPTTKEIEPKS